MECTSLAFPLLCAGNNGFDFEIAFEIARNSIKEYYSRKSLSEVILVVYDHTTVANVERAGYEIERAIDDTYVLQKDQKYIPPLQQAVNVGLSKAQAAYSENRDVINTIASQAVRRGLEWLSEPENQKKIACMCARYLCKK